MKTLQSIPRVTFRLVRCLQAGLIALLLGQIFFGGVAEAADPIYKRAGASTSGGDNYFEPNVWTPVFFGNIVFDDGGFFPVPGTELITVPTGIDWIQFTASLELNFDPTQYYVWMRVRKAINVEWPDYPQGGLGGGLAFSDTSINPQNIIRTDAIPVSEGDQFILEVMPVTSIAKVPSDYLWISVEGWSGTKKPLISTVQLTANWPFATQGPGQRVSWNEEIRDEIGCFDLAANPKLVTVPAGISYMQVSMSYEGDFRATPYSIGSTLLLFGPNVLPGNYASFRQPPFSEFAKTYPKAQVKSGIFPVTAGQTFSIKVDGPVGNNLVPGSYLTVYGWQN